MGSAGRGLGSRVQSAPLGLALVFAMVIIGTTTIVALGADSITSTQDQLDLERTENSLTQFDSQAAMVALGQSSTQEVNLVAAGEGGYTVDDDAGRMIITHRAGGSPKTLYDVEMGAVTYEGSDETRVAYQGGGVWQKSGTGQSVMVSPPEFHYREATLTLPLVTINGEGSVTGTTAISAGSSTQYYPDPANGRENPLESGEIVITVESEYYRAWGEYFETRTEGSVSYDHPNDTAQLSLTVPIDGPSVGGAVVSSGTGTSLSLKKDAAIDSYDSSAGNYTTTGGGGGGQIYTAGAVQMKKDATINGGLVVDDELTMKNGARIAGDLDYGGPLTLHSSPGTHVGGAVSSGATVPEMTAVDGLIDQKRESFDDTNDNGAHSGNITKLETRGTCNPCNITAGQYYLTDFDLEDDGQLYLKPGGNTIEIIVDGDFITQNDADIEVIGDGRVEFYVERGVEMKSKTAVTNEGDDAPQFWLYMNHDKDVDFKANSVFVGVVYGPGPDDTPGVQISTKASNQLYGALVGDVDEVKNGNYMHYDTALTDSQPVADETTLPALTYLHISTNEVNVTAK